MPEIDPGYALRLQEYIDAEQWEQAADELESLLRLNDGAWVLRSETEQKLGTYRHFVSSSEYAQQWLSIAPAPLLAIYRARVDSVVNRWWEDELADREVIASRIVRQALFSNRGEEALLWLAATAHERGEFFESLALLERLTKQSRLTREESRLAHCYRFGPIWLAWRRIPTDERTSELFDAMTDSAKPLPLIPTIRDPRTPIADVWARRIWLAIQQGSLEQARVEMEILRTLAPNARGSMPAHEGTWLEVFSQMLDKNDSDTQVLLPPTTSQQWPQLGNDLGRSNQTGEHFDQSPPDLAGEAAWSIRIPPQYSEQERLASKSTSLLTASTRRPTYFPIVFDDCVFVNQPGGLRAFQLTKGQPRWPLESEDDLDELRSGLFWEYENSASTGDGEQFVVGAPVFAMSSADEIVFARVGSPLTGTRNLERHTPAKIIAMDSREQASLLSGFPMSPAAPYSEFSGCPISDGESMYVVQRKSSRDRSRVTFTLVSYQLVSGGAGERLRVNWKRRLCDAETSMRTGWDERTQEFLTLVEGVLYVNSNAGVIAAFDAETGTPRWLVEYPRVLGEPSQGTASQRFANPCVVVGDLVVVAPADTADVMAIDRATGALIWSQTLPGIDSIVGITRAHVIGSGAGLVWLGRYNGVEYTSFPRRIARGAATHGGRFHPRGWGRAIHAPPYVLWPTRDNLYVFRDSPRSVQGADRRTWYEPELARRINLTVRKATGGNLLLANRMLLIAGSEQLWAFPLVPLHGNLESSPHLQFSED